MSEDPLMGYKGKVREILEKEQLKIWTEIEVTREGSTSFFKGILLPRAAFTAPGYINLKVDNDTVYDLDFEELSSIGITGRVIGGTASVYIENDDKRYLVYKTRKSRKNLITGLLIKNTASGSHEFNGCIETCVLPKNFEKPYKLVIDVDPGATVNIENINYR